MSLQTLSRSLSAMRHISVRRVTYKTFDTKRKKFKFYEKIEPPTIIRGWFAPEAAVSPATRETEQQPVIKHSFNSQNHDVEISTAEWHYVERLFPKRIIGKPNVQPGEVTPGGYKAPTANSGDHPYFVMRASTFLPDVRYDKLPGHEERCTIVLGVEGDIFKFVEDLKQYLFSVYDEKATCLKFTVNEDEQSVFIAEDYVNDVLDFLDMKGF